MTDDKTDDDTPHKRIVIEGINSKGQKFRPSDWAERMSGQLCTFQKRRIRYSPLLQPTLRDGHKSVLLDPALKDSNPALYESIMQFAKNNDLMVHEDDEDNDQGQ